MLSQCRKIPKFCPGRILIVVALCVPRLFAAEPPSKKEIDFNPVHKEIPKDKELRELPMATSICVSGGAKFRLRDQFDEARCREGGGEIRTTIESVDNLKDIKPAPWAMRPNHRPPIPVDSDFKRKSHPHYNPLNQEP